jgi:hypothetical protein
MHGERQILDKLDDIGRKLDTLMSAQADVNAAVAALNTFLTDVSNLLAALAAGGGAAVDTTALNAVIAQLPAVQAAVVAATPPAATVKTTSSTDPAVSYTGDES